MIGRPVIVTILLFVTLQADSRTQDANAVRQARHVRVTLEEGTNIAAALSPDGTTLAIDLLGSLWVMPVVAGTAARITDELGDARQPAWSPDGSALTFQSYRDGNWHVWTIAPDGSDLVQHTFGPFDDREPHWSPDGGRIAFSSDRSGNYDLWELTVADGTLRQRTTNRGDDFAPAWSPDGKQAFVANRANGRAIWTVSTEGIERVVATSEGQLAAPSWSPNGKSIAYYELMNGNRLILVDASGSDAVASGGFDSQRRIRLRATEAPRLIAGRGEDVFPFRVAWISEQEIIYTADGKVRQRRIGAHRVRDIPFQASVSFERPSYDRRRRDFDSPGPHRVKGIVSPAISPDGTTLAFGALGDLWTMPIGGPPQRLTSDAFIETDPMWSPDGSRLVYASDRGGFMELWLRNVGTGEERQLTDVQGAVAALPAWSPDGSRIAFLTGIGAVHVVEVASGSVKTVRDGLFHPGRPSWLSDSRTLALPVLRRYSSRFREGTNRVLLASIDSDTDRYVTPMPHRSLGTRNADGPVWAPNGQSAAFTADGALWIVTMSADGQPLGAPTRVADDLAASLSWTGDSRSLYYLANDLMKRLSLIDGSVAEVAIDLAWERELPSARYVIHAGRLFDGRSDRAQTNMDIVVHGHRIAAVASHDQSRHTGRVIDASRYAVIPGLIDMHAHQERRTGEVLGRMWLAYGVTSVREPSADPYGAVERREAIAAGVRLGPREFFTGPLVDGSRIYYSGSSAASAWPSVEKELERARVLGYDLIKTYVRLPDALQKRVIEYAHRHGIAVSSHELYPAVAFGADHVEHIRGTSRRGYSPKVTALNRSYRDVIDLLAASGMTITPTVAIMRGFDYVALIDSTLLGDPRFQALYPPDVVQFTEARLANSRRVGADVVRKRLAPLGRTVREVVRAGGRVVAGTDSPIVPYGVSLHTELETYVTGGLSPYEALQTSTLVAAQALGAGADLGSIEAGKLADMVVVEGDPLRNIRDTRRVVLVIKNGRVHQLEELLRRPEGSGEQSRR